MKKVTVYYSSEKNSVPVEFKIIQNAIELEIIVSNETLYVKTGRQVHFAGSIKTYTAVLEN